MNPTTTQWKHFPSFVGPGRLQQYTARPHPDSDKYITHRRNLSFEFRVSEFTHMHVYARVLLVSGQPIDPVRKVTA